MSTTFHHDKRTVQAKTEVHGNGWRLLPLPEGTCVNGYEIHMGRSECDAACVPFTSTVDASDRRITTGVADASGRIAGTYCHGLFDSVTVVRSLNDALRAAKGLPPLGEYPENRRILLENDLNRLAALCRERLSTDTIYEIMNNFQNDKERTP